ncbi:hypothetical protein B0187_02175 [Haemophilus paracuniculus]|uniref:Protein TonB n=1 Tax=Haemophilus paracuniculus TaxID=734 RepID=A0A1T0AUP4_9PAST|nr:energy transducer TonB [Haemophilus paracuniculus]OOS00316.1 hypothetical protein B0187_02175 [Haemophilus paracuniculus]
MNKKNSRTGLATSLLLHGAVFSGIWWVINQPQEKPPEEVVTSISMEMLAANLEQPQVAVAPPQPEETLAPEPEPEPEKTAEPEPVAGPVVMPKPLEKPIEKPKLKEKPKEPPKEKPKDKPKEKPKDPPLGKPKEKVKAEKPAKPIKALETGTVAKEGIVAKAIPNATQGIKAQAGVPNAKAGGTSPTGSATGNPTAKANSAGNQTANNANAASSGDNYAAYVQGLQRLLARKAKSNYPPREKMMRKQGIVTISFTVSPSGQLTNATVISSSGVAGLDAAAVKIANSTMYEPPINGKNQFTVPVKFEIE